MRKKPKSVDQIIKESNALRESGNNFFKSSMFPTARHYYHLSLRSFSKNIEETDQVIRLKIKIHSNLAAVEIKLFNFRKALFHCSHVLKEYDGHSGISDQRVKLYYRRFRCFFALERLEEALQDIKFCLMHRTTENERLFLNEKNKVRRSIKEREILTRFGTRKTLNEEKLRTYFLENVKRNVRFRNSKNILSSFNDILKSETSSTVRQEFEKKYAWDELREGEKQLYQFRSFEVAFRKFEDALIIFRKYFDLLQKKKKKKKNDKQEEEEEEIEDLPLHHGLGTVYFDIGILYGILCEYDTAVTYILKAEEIAKKIQDVHVLEGLYRQSALLLMKKSGLPKRKDYEVGRESEEEKGEEEIPSEEELEKQRRYCYTFRTCYSYLLNCMKIKKFIKDDIGSGKVQEEISKLFLREGKYEKSLEFLNKARAIYLSEKEAAEYRLSKEDQKEKKREKEENEFLEKVQRGEAERKVFQELKKYRAEQKKKEKEEEEREEKRLMHQRLNDPKLVRYLGERMNSLNNLEIKILYKMGKFEKVKYMAMSQDPEEENVREILKIQALNSLALEDWKRGISFTSEGIKMCQKITDSHQFNASYYIRNHIWENEFETAHYYHIYAKLLILKSQKKKKKKNNNITEGEKQTIKKCFDKSLSLYLKCLSFVRDWSMEIIFDRVLQCVKDSFDFFEKKEEIKRGKSRAVNEIEALFLLLEEYRRLVHPEKRKEKLELFRDCLSEVHDTLFPIFLVK